MFASKRSIVPEEHVKREITNFRFNLTSYFLRGHFVYPKETLSMATRAMNLNWDVTEWYKD